MIYPFSEQTIQKRAMTLGIAVITSFCLFLGIFALYFPIMLAHGGSLGEFLIIITGTFLMMGGSIFFTWKYSSKNLRSRKLEISTEEILFTSNDQPLKILFSDITQMTIRTNPLAISFKANGKNFVVDGYENMDEIVETFVKKVSPSVTKRIERKINWTNPLPAFFLCLIGIGLGALFIIFGRGTSLGRLFYALIYVGFGSYFTFWGPANLMKYQKLLGWLMIILGIIKFFFKSF